LADAETDVAPPDIAPPSDVTVTQDAVEAGGGRSRQERLVSSGIAVVRSPKSWAVLVYLLLVLFGVTQSSISVNYLRTAPHSSGGPTFGRAQSIRSDEFLTYTPIDLGVMASGTAKTATPLAQAPDLIFQLPSGGVVESIVFFDGSVLRLGPHLPAAQLFAAYWWLPFLLLVLTLPGWLRRVGANRQMAWLATGLIVLSPSAVWWSFMPIRTLGFLVAGSVAAMVAVEKLLAGRRLSAVGLCVLGGILLARLPTYYVPWSITIGVPVVLATLAWLLADRQARRLAVRVVLVTAGVAILGAAGVYLENLAAVHAELGTIYPGQRISSSGTVGMALLFGAPGLYVMQHNGIALSSSNKSEISSAYTVAAVWALVVWLTARRRQWTRDSAALAVLAAATSLWMVWTTVTSGRLGSKIPIANRVPPERAAQTVGFLAVLVLALVLSRIERPMSLRTPIVAALTCGVLTASGVSALRASVVPSMHVIVIFAAAAVVSVLVLVATLYPDRWVPVVAILAAAACVVGYVNPIQIGLSDVHDSAIAKQLAADGKQARSDGQYWATDSEFTDALLVANGVPALSGHQVTGPIVNQWKKLDPTEEYKSAWNRGASYVRFSWSDDQAPKITVGPAPDQIIVNVDPCVVSQFGFKLTHIITASASMPQSCLVRTESFEWMGTPHYVYDVGGS